MTNAVTQADLGRGLRWVQGEIDHGLNQVRQILAEILDEGAALDRLQEALPLLHQISQVCAVARCQGGQLHAAQLEVAARRLLAQPELDRDAVLAELVAASYALSKYVGIVADGLPDHPLAALQSINALRGLIGLEAWSASVALAAHWQLAHRLPVVDLGERSQAELEQALATWRPRLLPAFARLQKQPQDAAAWQRIKLGGQALAPVLLGSAQAQLWALQAQLANLGPRLPAAAHPTVVGLIKRSLAGLQHALQASPERLESAARVTLAGWALLVVRIDRKGSLAQSLLSPLGLHREELLPQRLQVIQAAMRGPAEDSLAAALHALQADFAQLKDEVESVHGQQPRDNEVIDEVLGRFRSLASTARGLGDETVADQLLALTKQFAGLSQSAGDAAGWSALAEGLIQVEQALSTGLLGYRAQQAARSSNLMTSEARASTLRECLVSLVKIKHDIDALVRGRRPEQADQLLTRLTEICGALEVFGEQALEQPFRELQKVFARADFVPAMLERSEVVQACADAIASAEYLLEALRDADPEIKAESARVGSYVQILQHTLSAAPTVPAAEASVQAAPSSAEVDADLREIFLEEAQDVLGALQSLRPAWERGEDGAAVADIRRAFHTLKGSGRMVGAEDIGRFGRDIEQLLNQILDARLERGPDVDALVLQAIEQLPDIVARFAAGQPAADLVDPLCQRAKQLLGEAPTDTSSLAALFLEDARSGVDALQSMAVEAPASRGAVSAWHSVRGGAAAISAEALVALATAAEHLYAQSGLVQKPLPADLHSDAVDALRQGLEGLASGQPCAVDAELVARLEQTAAELLGDDSSAETIDPELRLIFCSEAQDLLERAETLLAECRAHQGHTQQAQELQRVFHTLKGSAHTAQAQGLGAIGVDLDAAAKRWLEAGAPQDADTFAFFARGVQAAWNLVDAFQAGRDEAAPPWQQPGTEPSVEAEDPAIPLQTVATQAPVQPDTVAVADEAVDEELLEVFLPECDELLDGMDQAFAKASEVPAAHTLDALFRALHTLKGGARMAGLTQLGEAAHALESQVEALRVGPEPQLGSEQLRELQSAADQLRQMRDQAAPSAEATTSLLEELDADTAEDASEAVAPGSDLARVPVSHLDGFLSDVGEVSMFRSRLEQQLVGLSGGLRDLDQTIARLRAQIRDLEGATDAQIQARVSGMQQSQAEGDRYAEEYDPLEMDRYTRMQELTRSITESIADLASVHRSMRESVGEGEAMVLQQARLSTTLQEGLLSTLAVPFGRQEGRLARVLRQAAQDENKAVELRIDGAEVELDRNVLERIVPAIEHILRNSVTHGIEDGPARAAANKPAVGQVSIQVRRDNNRVLLDIRDDGRGLDYALIRTEAVRRGLLAEDAELSDDRIAQFIFEPGFSTAKELSLSAGRGVGMDVVAAEVRQLGGRIDVGSESGKGCQFTISLPFSVAVTQTLLVRSGEAEYAIPLASITGVARLPVAEVQQALASDQPLAYAGTSYEVHELAPLVQARAELPASGYVPVLFVAAGSEVGSGRHFAVVVEHLLGTREVVAKTVGQQIAAAPGVAGATIQPDGRVVLIMDLGALILELERRGLRGEAQQAPEEQRRQPLVMVIDDSITMRKVAERILGRAGYRVQLAKDGADGVAQLQTVRPDLVLLDIEMPRMDGFEVASFIRNDANLQSIPILMITSRSGDKHRQRAAGLEVNGYLIKPYQEQQLLGDIAQQLREPTLMSASA